MAVAVEGLRQLIRDLQKAGIEVEDLKDIFSEIANVAADQMQSRVPHASGVLRASVRGNRAKNKAVVKVGRARVPYAAAQQWGWPNKPGGIRGSFGGHHFFESTDQAMETKAAEMLEKGIQKLMEQVQGAEV